MNSRYRHGGEDAGGKVQYDFSININPFGMPESVKRSLMADNECFEAYPDTECSRLREEISKQLISELKIENEQYRVSEIARKFSHHIVCGNGASDLIYRICGLMKFKRAVIIGPAFSEYERALRQNGCVPEYLITAHENDFKTDCETVARLKEILEYEKFNKYDKVVFLCNPSNPAGSLTGKDTVLELAEICRKTDTMLIIDECFVEFVKNSPKYSVAACMTQGTLMSEKGDCESIGEGYDADSDSCFECNSKFKATQSSAYALENIIVLRAFTKIYAMAGMRLGYAICSDSEMAEKIRDFGPPWSVSGPAQKAGITALGETEYVRKTVNFITQQRSKMYTALTKLGMRVFAGNANYLLFTAPAALGEAMLMRGISIRDCSDYIGLGRKDDDINVYYAQRKNSEKVRGRQDMADCGDDVHNTENIKYFRAAIRSADENDELLRQMELSLGKMLEEL